MDGGSTAGDDGNVVAKTVLFSKFDCLWQCDYLKTISCKNSETATFFPLFDDFLKNK